MESCLYRGRLRHRRYTPKAYEFEYGITMLYLDLAEMDDVFRGRCLWSASRPAPFRFRRSDHLGAPERPLDESVRNLFEERGMTRPKGPIRILTQLRYLGFCFNPVSFYYCFGSSDADIESFVAEVNNTPWGERHVYVMNSPEAVAPGHSTTYCFEKVFHVSPFMGMDYAYRCVAGIPGKKLVVHMENLRNDEKHSDATLSLSRVPITTRALAREALLHPLVTQKTVAAIYFEALKLWWKGFPFFPHPGGSPGGEAKQP